MSCISDKNKAVLEAFKQTEEMMNGFDDTLDNGTEASQLRMRRKALIAEKIKLEKVMATKSANILYLQKSLSDLDVGSLEHTRVSKEVSDLKKDLDPNYMYSDSKDLEYINERINGKEYIKTVAAKEAATLARVIGNAFKKGVELLNKKTGLVSNTVDEVYSDNLFKSMKVQQGKNPDINGMYAGVEINGKKNNTTMKQEELLKHLAIEIDGNSFNNELDLDSDLVAMVDNLYTGEDGQGGFRETLWESLSPYIDNMTPGKQGHFPALNMLLEFGEKQYSKNGKEYYDVKLNDYVGKAVVVSAVQGLVRNTDGIYTVKDRDEDLAFDDNVDIGTLGANLGKEVMKNLGVKEASNVDTDARVFARLESSFGSLAVDVLVKGGYLESPYTMDNKAGASVNIDDYMANVSESNMPQRMEDINGYNRHLMLTGDGILRKYAKPPKDANQRELLDSLRDTSDVFDIVYGEADALRSFPGSEPKEPSKSIGVKGRDAPGVQVAATSILANQGMKFNSGLDELLPLLSSEENKNKLTEKLLGKDLAKYRTAFAAGNEKLLEELTYDEKNSLEGKLQQIGNVIGDFEAFLKDNDKEGVYYQDWFVAVQDRLHVGTTGLNYMADKHMVRWTMSPKAWTEDENGKVFTASSKRLDATIKKFSDDTNDGLFLDITKEEMEDWATADAIVQAFEGATIAGEKVQGVDKEHPRYALVMARKILDTKVNTLRKQILNADHLGHAALAVANVKRYQDSTDRFESDIYGEVDGKTNGVFHRLYQFGDKEFAKSFGALVGATGKDSKTLREAHKEETRATDVYVKVGIDFTRYLNDLVEAHSWIAPYVSAVEIDQDDVTQLEKELWSNVRKDVKDPTMISMYGAGLNGLYNKFLENVAAEVAKDARRNPEGFVKGLRDSKVYGARDIAKGIQAEVGNSTVEDLLGTYDSSMAELFGDMIKQEGDFDNKSFAGFSSVFETHFKGQFDLNKNVTDLLGSTYKAVSKLMQAEVDKVLETNKSGALNKRFLKDLMDKYKPLLPGVEGFGAAVDLGDNKLYLYKIKKGDDGVDAGIDVVDLPFYEPGYDGSKKNAYAGGIKSLNSDRFLLSGPGVSAGPILVQSLDSANLSMVVVEAQATYGMTVMPMHDAIIRPPRMVDTSNMFNRAGHEVNTSISYLDNIIAELKGVRATLSSVYNKPLPDLTKATKNVEAITFDDGLSTLIASKLDNDQMREDIKKMEAEAGFYIAQMDGTPGTVYTADGNSASFSTKEQVATLQARLIDEDSREELFEAHKTRIANDEDVSLLYTSNKMDSDIVTEQTKKGILGTLDALSETKAGKKALTELLVKALDKPIGKSYNLDILIKEFKKGCNL